MTLRVLAQAQAEDERRKSGPTPILLYDATFGTRGPLMNAPAGPTTPSRSTRTRVRHIAVAVILGGVVFLVLWLMAFSLVTSLLIGSGCCVIIVAASTTSDLIETVVDVIATIVFGILAAIAAAVAAVFSLFGS